MLLYLLAMVGPRPRGWRDQTWRYEQCTFVSARMTSKQLATIFESGEHHWAIADSSATVEFRQGQIGTVHAPSLAQYAQLRLPWPSVIYSPGIAVDHINSPQGYLVGVDDQPSFPAFSGAFNAFFYDSFAVTGTQNPQLGNVSIHWLDTRARVRRVRIRPASLEVWVDGSALDGASLELNGVEWRTTVAIEKPRVVIQLPSGLPTDAWLWLKRGPEWLDFRSLNQWGGYQSPDVELELPRDPVAELTRLAAQGEGAMLEYKEELPRTDAQKRSVFKTVVAFANGAGGTILFGVTDAGDIKGLTGKLTEERRRLTDLVRSAVNPPPRSASAKSVLMAGRC